MLVDLVERIQRGSEVDDEPDAVLATIVVAGGSDEDWASSPDRAEQAARKFHGRLVNWDKSEWLVATFDGPARALRFAEELVHASGTQAGVHIGEITVRGDEIAGDAFGTAQRLAAIARRGQVLVTGIVRDLAPDSGIEFRPMALPSDMAAVPAVFEARPGAVTAG